MFVTENVAYASFLSANVDYLSRIDGVLHYFHPAFKGRLKCIQPQVN